MIYECLMLMLMLCESSYARLTPEVLQKPSDMLGIPREVAEHALKIRPGFKSVKPRLRRFNKEKHRAIDEEITKLLVSGFIKEVYHPEWLANPILV